MEITPNLHAFLWTSPNANNCNTYLIQSEKKNILIDPGHVPYFDHVREGLSRLGLSLENIDLIICTHAHPDHIEAVRLFTNGTTPFAMHGAEWELVQKMAPFLKNPLNSNLDQYTPNFFLTEGELIVGNIVLEVYHTPGHSPGGVTLWWPAEKALFTGDLIFAGGVGRTDLPGGNGEELKKSIHRMAALNAQWLLPGHGEVLSGTDAVKSNFAQVEQMWFGYV
ncbi:MAG: MBL fold metallo-hydrolase [Desulfobacteraceae bacterium]